ncbi:MAG TPA: PatB family C-S lyase [Bacillota bacterium]|nr:PatB family C-S lyase [Bacillota bacterium]
MEYDFDQVLDRRNTNCEKWDYLEEHFGRADVLPMWVADMDFPSPPEVVQAIQERAKHPSYGYTGTSDSFFDSIVGWMDRRHGWAIEREWISTTPGVVPGLAASVLAFTEPGDNVIVQSPVYPPFFRVVENNGRRLLNNELVRVGDRYEMDWDDLEAKLGEGAKLLLLCSPANPVGRVWSEEELARISEMCVAHGTVIASDEIHSDIIYSWARHTPFGALSPEAAENSVTFVAPSKTFNVPGLSTSVAIIPNSDLREGFNRVLSGLGLGTNLFGITALEAAYTYGDRWLDDAIAYIEENLRFMVEFLGRQVPEIRVVPPEGTYVIWLDCRGLGLDPDALHRFMVEEARVGLSDGTFFGLGGEGYQRINIACPRPILREGLERIASAAVRLRGGVKGTKTGA